IRDPHECVSCASVISASLLLSLFFFFNNPPPTDIYTLSLHDALPISKARARRGRGKPMGRPRIFDADLAQPRPHGEPRNYLRRGDRKSTRLNSSHDQISYAVFCLKKKKKTK